MKFHRACAVFGMYFGLNFALIGCGGGQGSGGSFSSKFPAVDGSGPSGLVQGSDGNFYGTTTFGGQFAKGTVFSISPDGAETVLYAFAGGSTDGAYPAPGLIPGAGGFYGTTYEGGVGVCPTAAAAFMGGAYPPPSTCGTVFLVTPDGAETVLYFFRGSADGGQPSGALIQGSDGNFYGTTNYGGVTSAGCGTFGCGTVFRMTPDGAETVLYAFTGGINDDSVLASSLVQGSDGDFYGITNAGGANNGGTVFKVTRAGVQTVLHSFTGCVNGSTDGCQPVALIQGSDGNFYGTTTSGGGAMGEGTVFKITPSGVETVLYSFPQLVDISPDGAGPNALIEGSDGNFYGTTAAGGALGAASAGTVFKITASGVETVLYSFTGGLNDGHTDGYSPNALIQGSDGDFYGTTPCGGANQAGTVFKINPAGGETNLYSFNGGKNCQLYP